MAQQQISCTLTLNFKWWVNPYVNTLILFCKATGLEPDVEKITDFIVSKGIYFTNELR